MFLLLFEFRDFIERVNRSIDTSTREALGREIGKEVDELAFALTDDWGKNLESGALF
jgi:hypothetical protein